MFDENFKVFKKTTVDNVWNQVDTMYIRDYGSPAKSNVASFDVDSTLIKTKSEAKFPKSKDDLTFCSLEVIPKL